MKESKRRRSLSGAVLIMILTVMFILIILLMATLTTVTTANQRIYTKFEENQAYYTARSALDVFTQNMLDDGNYVTTETYEYTDTSGNDITGTNAPFYKQGLGLQFDLYRLTAQEGVQNVAQSDLEDVVDTTSDPNLKKIQYKTYFGTDSSKVQTDANGKEYIEYTVELPVTADDSNAYGKLSDSCAATIKVEVLDRTYDIGDYDISSYTDKNDFFESASNDDKAEAVISGNRENDTMRIKVTATTVFDGVDGVAVVILKNTMPVTPPGTRAITVLGSTYELVDITVIGGISSPVDTEAQNAIVIGDTFIGENIDVTSGDGSTFYFNNSECLYVDGDASYQNNITFVANDIDNITSIDERPFVYIDGDFYVTANWGGLKSNDVDLVVKGDLIVTADGELTDFKGNIFVNGTIDLTGAGANNQTVNGTVYCPTINCNEDYPLVASTSYETFNVSEEKDGDGKIISKKISLPDGSSRTLPFKENIYSEYYEGGDINDPTKLFTAEDLAFVSKEDRANGTHTTDTFKALADSVSGANLLKQNGSGKWDTREKTVIRGERYEWAKDQPGDYDWYYETTTVTTGEEYEGARDLTAGVYYAQTGNNNFNLNITGGGTVELILGAGTYMGEILVDDNTTLKIYSYDEDLEYTFRNFSIVNKGIKDRIDNGDNIYVGQYGDKLISPTISLYFSKGCKLIDDGANDFYTAYIQSPQADVQLRQAHSLNNVYYNNVSVGTQKVNVLGSVLCANLTTINHAGVAYVNPNAPSIDAGEPIHSFESLQYVRN